MSRRNASLARSNSATVTSRPVRDGDLVAAQQPAAELLIVIAHHRLSAAIPGHAPHEAQTVDVSRTAIGQVADEQRLPPVRVRRPDRSLGAGLERLDHVAERLEQRREFVEAAVHVADDVERAAQVASVRPERLTNDLERLDLSRVAQHVHVAKALPLELADVLPERARLTHGDPAAPGAHRVVGVSRLAERGIEIEHDRDRQARAGGGRGATSTARSGRCTEVASTTVSRRRRRRRSTMWPSSSNVSLVRLEGLLVIADERPAVAVRRNDLGRPKVAGSEGRLARARRTDQADEREIGNREPHVVALRVKMAICDGAPCSASSGPSARCSTVYPCRSAIPAHQCSNAARPPLEAMVLVPNGTRRQPPRTVRCSRRWAW